VAAQDRGGGAGAGDDLQDLGQDLVFHRGQRLRGRVRGCGGDLGAAGGAAGQPGRDRGADVRGVLGAGAVLGGGPAGASAGSGASWPAGAAWVRSW
jgi:hypothetical protein